MSAPVADANPLTRKLWHIAGTGDLEQLNKLLNEGAEVNAGDRTGVTALMRAAYHGQLPMVRALIEHGADPNAKDRSGLTALMMAKHGGHQEIVEALLSSGAQAKKEGATTPRRIVSVIDESSSPAATHEVTPAKTSEVKTLQEPPDIWDLVHTTQPESDSPIAYSPSKTLGQSLSSIVPGKFISMRALALGVGVLIICAAAVFGLMAWRSDGSATDDAGNQRVEASELRPSSVSQRSATAKTLNDESRRIARRSNQLTKIAAVGKLWGERADQLASPAAATAIMPVKKPVTRPPTNATASFSKQNRNVRKTTRPESDQATNTKTAKKEPTQQANDPIKPSVTQKPKVIQWP